MSRTKTYTGAAAFGIIALVIALWALVIGIAAAIFTWAWNLVVPTTFNGPHMDFGAAVALLIVFLILRAFLFGGRSSK